MSARPLVALCSVGVLAVLLTSTGVAPARAQEYNPLVYENLEIEVKVSGDGSLTLSIAATLRNDGRVPVVPGYGRLPVTGVRQRSLSGLPLPGAERANLSVDVLSARDVTRGVDMEVVPLWENGSLVLRYSLWQPLRPGESESFELTIRVSDAVASGVLFDELSFGMGPFSNRVESGRVAIIPPEGRRFTYASPDPSGVNGGALEWDLSGLPAGGRVSLWVEFSPLPLPRLPIKGYFVFWGGVLTAISIPVVSRLIDVSLRRRGRRRPRARGEFYS